MIGWLRSSQLGVVLQDNLQLLTQHDVPSNLQLAREEGLTKKTTKKHLSIFFFFPKSHSLFCLGAGWLLIVFKNKERAKWAKTPAANTNKVSDKRESLATGSLAAEQSKNIILFISTRYGAKRAAEKRLHWEKLNHCQLVPLSTDKIKKKIKNKKKINHMMGL